MTAGTTEVGTVLITTGITAGITIPIATTDGTVVLIITPATTDGADIITEAVTATVPEEASLGVIITGATAAALPAEDLPPTAVLKEGTLR